MTETEWFASDDPSAMLEHLGEPVERFRKFQLVAVACCRRLDHVVADLPPGWRNLVRHRIDSLEDSADSTSSPFDRGDLTGAVEPLAHVWSPEVRWASQIEETLTRRVALALAQEAAVFCAGVVGPESDFGRLLSRDEQRAQCRLVHDIFGNPFRDVVMDPDWLAWRDGTAVKLARTAYDDRRWDVLPILADALHEAGCTDDAILDHCRGPGPHVRGCWVVDLVLGMS
jgi:hypothetical protein